MTKLKFNRINTIAIIGAMEQEIELLKKDLNQIKTKQFGSFTVFQGEYADKQVALILSGIGKVNAAVATTLVINQLGADCVINTGSAGGLGANLKVGDVVIGEKIAHHDVDVTAFGYQLGQVPKLPALFESHSQLIAVTRDAATAFSGASVHAGLILSGDQFIHNDAKVAEIRQHFSGVSAVEMEAAAIAQTCDQLNVPFVIVRAISDLADGKAEMSFEQFLQTASVHSAQMVQRIIQML